jgi:hypothetical protein
VNDGRVECVVQAQRPRDPVDPGRIHFLEAQDVGRPETVALENLDGTVDLASQLDVERDQANG